MKSMYVIELQVIFVKKRESMLTALLVIGIVGIFFVLMSVRLIFLKDGEFKGTCASQSPFLNKEGVTCGYCGREVRHGDRCDNSDSEVTKVMEKFS